MSQKLLLTIVVNDNTKMIDVMSALAEAGVPGGTLIETQGMGRILSKEVPLFAGLRNLASGSKPFNFTIFTVLDDESLLDEIKVILKEILEDEENNGGLGIYFTSPVIHFGTI
jgi:nitrogen regulatory protein P-II 1